MAAGPSSKRSRANEGANNVQRVRVARPQQDHVQEKVARYKYYVKILMLVVLCVGLVVHMIRSLLMSAQLARP